MSLRRNPVGMGEKCPNFARLFSDFQKTYGAELKAKVSRLDSLVGRKHWLSVGTYKENLVRSALAMKLPRRFEIGTGFVMGNVDGKPVLSKQIDILIWNSQDNAPFFRDGEFVIVPPEAVAGAIEVKSTLTAAELKKSLVNLDSLMRFREFYGRIQVVHRSIFAFGIGKNFSFPISVFNGLNRHYRTFKEFPLDDERMRLTGADHDRWSLPWIDNIAILDNGVVNLAQWAINDNPQVSYAAYSTNRIEDKIDAYGFLERSVLMDLMLGYQKYNARHTIPGYATAAFSSVASLVEDNRFIVYPDVEVTRVGRLEGPNNDAWIKTAYHPPEVKADDTGEEPKDEDEEAD